MNEDRINHNFTYNPPTAASIVKLQSLRFRFRGLAHHIDGMVSDSREKSLALTSLEEALFWTNAGIVRNQQAEAEALEPKVWATAHETVMCSECGFEVLADRVDEYKPCDGGVWAPVTT